ncbi:MAG: Ig-like domain repeat protein [Treponema sp.]|jgi:hypothetical protein|nr:Ig-like domain repeat protein [Treponema sp.]
MKKLDVATIIVVFCIFCGVHGSLISCKEFGLGPAVDMTGPTLEISSPNYMDNVRSSVVIAGSAQDAESEIGEITVILTQAQREWRAVNGAWRKRDNPQAPWESVPASEGTFWKKSGAFRVDWSLEMDLSGLPEQEYTIKASARDSFYNSETQSSQSRVVIYDNTPPIITVLSPVLTTGGDSNLFEEVKDALDGKLPRDITWLSELLNDDFEFRWQISDDVSVKDIEIQLADKDGVVYYESTQFDIPRNGSVAIPKDKIYDRETQPDDSPVPLAAREYLQILTKSFDRAGNYEWKRNGWVVWDPESDKPWSTPPQEFGETEDAEQEVIAAGTSFLGQAYDDDGVKSVTLYLYKKGDSSPESGYPITINADDTPVSFQWSFVPPSVEAHYRLESTVADKNGVSGDTQRAYFRTRILGDPPEAVLQTPGSDDPLIGDKNGGIAFTGYVTDNSAVVCAYIAWIHPDNPLTNRAFKNAGYKGWTLAKTALSGSSPYVDTDSSNSKVWALPYGAAADGGKGKKYDFSLTLNRWTDLAAGGAGAFSTQTFVTYVEDDAGGIAVSEWTTGRDIDAPEVAIQKVRVNDGEWQAITDSLLLPALGDSDTLTLQGVWSDNSVAVWEDPLKIKDFKATWNGIEFPIASHLYNAGTVSWTSAAVTADKSAGSLKIKDSPAANIRAEIIDLAGNRAVTDESFMVETDVPQIARISSSNESGAYNQGKTITVTLEFNKSVTWAGADPSLVLTDTNNASLEFAAPYTSGKGASKINFAYIVGASVNTSGRLDVKKINTPSEIASNAKPALITLPSQLNSLAGGKNIVLDTTAPTITSVNAITSAGAYPAGRTLYFTVTASESVTVSGVPVLKFNNNQQSGSVQQTAGNTLLFSLTTAQGKDTPALKVTEFSAGTGDIADDAGNKLAISLPNAGMSGSSPSPVIAIDTDPPSAPAITGVTANAVYFDRNHSFAITGLESDGKAEYTVNNGNTWNAYSASVSLSMNGTYQIKVRQTDKAGNLSQESALYAVTVDAGKLLTKISSPQSDGVYKEGETIEIDVYTRKSIAISNTNSPYLTLNIENNSVTKKITGATNVGGAGTQWRFTYVIAAGDAFINKESALRVAAISAGGASVTISGADVTADFQTLTDIDSAMRLENQKKIRVLTGAPAITKAELKAVSSGNEYTGAKLTLTFDRLVYKGSGSIVLTQDTNNYIPPAALTPAQYAKAGGAGALGSHYTYGVNGADSSYTPDLTGKYTLNYDKNPADVKTTFINANMHVVAISASSSEVAITNDESANTGTVVITLAGSYAPPTFGAAYTVNIPANAFKDEFNTGSAAHSGTYNLDGVNKPVVRVQKKRAELADGWFTRQNREEWWVKGATASKTLSPGDLEGGTGTYAAWGETAAYWQTPGTTLNAGETPQESDYDVNPDWVKGAVKVYVIAPTISKVKVDSTYVLGAKGTASDVWGNWIKDLGGDDLTWGANEAIDASKQYTGVFYIRIGTGVASDGAWANNLAYYTAEVWAKYDDAKAIHYTEPSGVYRQGPSYYARYNTGSWQAGDPTETDGAREYIKVIINRGENVQETRAVQPQQASVKIDCQTPGAIITYGMSEITDSVGMGIADNTPSNKPWITTFAGGNAAVIRLGLPDHSMGDPSNPSSASQSYSIGSTVLNLGQADYNALKVKLIVKAAKDGAAAYAYESANKTVVEFRFTSADGSGDYAGGDGRDIGQDEKLWIQGGDSPSGPSGIPGYPLSWDNTKTGLNLMTGANESTPAATTWRWVSWEISATTYIGFAAGGVDNDTKNGDGPASYSVSIEGWSPYKEAYALYPGEKRVLRSDRCGRGGSVYINGQGRGVFGFTKTKTSNRP